jgi:hypothetical protein
MATMEVSDVLRLGEPRSGNADCPADPLPCTKFAPQAGPCRTGHHFSVFAFADNPKQSCAVAIMRQPN